MVTILKGHILQYTDTLEYHQGRRDPLSKRQWIYLGSVRVGFPGLFEAGHHCPPPVNINTALHTYPFDNRVFSERRSLSVHFPEPSLVYQLLDSLQVGITASRMVSKM